MKKVLVTLIVMLLLEMTIIPTMYSGTIDTKIVKASSESISENCVNSIETSSSYDYGFMAGRLLNRHYKILTTLFNFLEDREINKKYFENQMENLEQYYPFFLEELRGLSASTNIKLETLFLIQSKLCSLFGGECTATISTGKATKNNETFLTFNVDTSVENIRDILFQTILHRIFSFKFWIARINTMEYRYAFWGIPVLYEFPILNEEGLGWGSPGTLLTENKSRCVDEGPGIATLLLEKLAMMTCKNVSEVAKLYNNIERASQKGKGWFNMYDGSSSCFCDKEGGILVIEQTHNYILTVFGNSTDITGAPEGILWHTNHHQWLDPNLTGSVYPSENPSSAFRAERAQELLEQYYGNITLDVCKKIARDHGGGYNRDGKDSGDICRHPDKYSLKVNTFGWIIVPKELTVYMTHNSPCKSIFWKHDFTRQFT